MFPKDVVVGLGSNLGERQETLRGAVQALRALGRLLRVSSVYESAPVGPPQPDYLNAAVRLSFAGRPETLLNALLGIEQAAGRERRIRWGPRTLDLDILWIRGLVVETAELSVPHPELSVRPFALLPLLDVAPDATDPRSGTAYREVLGGLNAASIRRISADRLVSLAPHS